MNDTIFLKNYIEPPVDRKKILHYAKSGAEDQILLQIQQLLEESLPHLSYKIAYGRFPINSDGNALDLGFARVHSNDLKNTLLGCNEIILFAATIGIQADRLISKYSRLSPFKGLLMQAIGTERVESLCDLFCLEMKKQLKREGLAARPRFSPGYGDLPLSLQKEIIQKLDCTKNIGISLNQQLLMTPSKSITAIIGLEENIT